MNLSGVYVRDVNTITPGMACEVRGRGKQTKASDISDDDVNYQIRQIID